MLSTAVIGAGPYGLSIAAHLRHQRVPYRIFGRLMDSWQSHMPKGMMLKSDGFASNIYDPENALTLAKFCAEKGIPYGDSGIPVSLETFCAYGRAFRDRLVPDLEDKQVVDVRRSNGGFEVRLDDGETAFFRRVVLAVGITHYEQVPSSLADLPPAFFSHSAWQTEPAAFRGKTVVVIGGGASALDMAGLVQEAGAEVHLVARRQNVRFHSAPTGEKRSLWDRVRHPSSGLGPGVRSRFYSNAPNLFHYLPEGFRIRTVKTALGPAGGYFIKDKVVGKVQMHLACHPEKAEIQGDRVCLQVRSSDGTQHEIVAHYIIAATGYKVRIDRLTFLSDEIRASLKHIDGAPELSSKFESSVPGLYFAGVSAGNSFGPVMRFAYGAKFAARRISSALQKSSAHDSAAVPSARAVASAE